MGENSHGGGGWQVLQGSSSNNLTSDSLVSSSFLTWALAYGTEQWAIKAMSACLKSWYPVCYNTQEIPAAIVICAVSILMRTSTENQLAALNCQAAISQLPQLSVMLILTYENRHTDWHFYEA